MGGRISPMAGYMRGRMRNAGLLESRSSGLAGHFLHSFRRGGHTGRSSFREQDLQAFKYEARKLVLCGKDSPKVKSQDPLFETLNLLHETDVPSFPPPVCSLARSGPVQDRIQSFHTDSVIRKAAFISAVLHTAPHCTPGWHHC